MSWFKGAIHSVRVTHAALEPEDFMEFEIISDVKEIQENQLKGQLFPNPIISFGHLKYQLEESSKVSIKMFNIHGEEVANIFEGFKNAGSHELEINRNHLNAGIYFVVIESGNKSEVQKIIFAE